MLNWSGWGNTLTAVERKKARLLYRINRFAEADRFCFYPTKLPAYESLHQGCVRENIGGRGENVRRGGRRHCVWRVCYLFPDGQQALPSVLRKVADKYQCGKFRYCRRHKAQCRNTGILAANTGRRARELLVRPISYSIAFFDKRPKQNYIINF